MTGDGERPERSRRVNFARVNQHALANAAAVARGLLPEGRIEGREYVARNPLRPDRRLGSFKVNLSSGKWADFATGDGGGDLVSLAAFVAGISQRDAAIKLAESMGVSPWE